MNAERGAVVAGNWKDVNMTVAKSLAWADEFNSQDTATISKPNLQLALFPPLSAAYAFKQHIGGLDRMNKMVADGRLAFGAQDISPVEGDKVRVTGSHHPNLFPELRVSHVLLGHSERRLHLDETNELIRKKLDMALKYGLTPVLCVGENLGERDAKQTNEVIRRQLSVLEGIPTEIRKRMTLAYEPVWAIGTGRTPTGAEANDTCGFARKESGVGHVIYGGSVTSANAEEFFAQPEIDGALPGGASEKPLEFFGIAQAATHHL